MYPHERSLVKRYENRPFVIIGVNSDRDRAKLKARIKEENITWRSFWAGSTGGPIPKKWNVSAWPTLYYLDHNGVIRAKNVRNEKQMDELIEKLVVEAEGAAKGADEAPKKAKKKKVKVPERGL